MSAKRGGSGAKEVAEKRDRLSQLESRWALAKEAGALPMIGGVIGGTGAYFTRFMEAWAPLSWIFAAAVGAMLFQAWSLLRSWQGEREERKRRIALLEAPKGQIKPRQRRFEGERIYVTDLVPPLEYVVRDKEFRDCEIIGPANIIFQASRPNGAELVNCTFAGCDGVVIDNQVLLQNVAVFEDCSFRDCRFVSITLMMPVAMYQFHRNALPGLVWLNSTMLPRD